jgi:hypothetical protein
MAPTTSMTSMTSTALMALVPSTTVSATSRRRMTRRPVLRPRRPRRDAPGASAGTQDEAEDGGADPVTILANRVGTVAGFWQGADPLVRRVIEQDVLMGGVYPDKESLRLALRAVPAGHAARPPVDP